MQRIKILLLLFSLSLYAQKREEPLKGSIPGETREPRYIPQNTIIISQEEEEWYPIEERPKVYIVKPGDTLWDLSQRYFGSPETWPKLWSYNPTITNPHWIYPGDKIYLSKEREPEAPRIKIKGEEGVGPSPAEKTRTKIKVSQIKRLDPSTIFLRAYGFVSPYEFKRKGIIVGSKEDKQLLAEFDKIYVKFEGQKKLGSQRYVIYKVIQDIEHPITGDEYGKLVRILGTLRIQSYNPKNQIARATILESLFPIERGDFVGPFIFRLNQIPPKRNTKNLKGIILTSLLQIQIIGQHHLVFIDRGKRHGVLPGNHFFVLRRGDGYPPKMEVYEQYREEFPPEIIAELRVIEAKENSSLCLIIQSKKALRVGDMVEMKKGL
jgi:hypothetical protein